MEKLSFTDLQYMLFSLSNLFNAGVLTSDAFTEMQHLQPKHAEFWRAAAKQSASGQSLAEILRPILDAPTHTAIAASENSGTLAEVFTALEAAMQEKAAIRKTLTSIAYPFGILIAALSVFLLFLAFVIPALSKTLPSSSRGEKSTLNIVSDALHDFLMANGIYLGIALIAAIAILVVWLRNPDNRNAIIAAVDQIPVLGPAVRDIYYGEWATHLAINTGAGTTVIDAIKLTHKMMPAHYHPEILAIANNATRIGLAAAASPQQNPADPRNKIPFLIANAFRFVDRTGTTDTPFRQAGAALITQGKKRINLFVATATNIIIPLAAILNASALLPYFMQIGESISKLH